jgi:hypothetical protein
MQSDRPTVPPAFDVERYARESDAKVATARAVAPPAEDDPTSGDRETPQSAVRLATRRPVTEGASADEAWATAMQGTPVVVMPAEVLMGLPLDHRAGYLISLIDGATDLDTVLEIAMMPREDALRLLRDLFESGVVDFRAG